MKDLSWDLHAWEDYLYWQARDKNMLKRINNLIIATVRQPFDGLGKPEHLKGDLAGLMSRRINDEHRFVYKVYQDRIHILACRHHY